MNDLLSTDDVVSKIASIRDQTGEKIVSFQLLEISPNPLAIPSIARILQSLEKKGIIRVYAVHRNTDQCGDPDPDLASQVGCLPDERFYEIPAGSVEKFYTNPLQQFKPQSLVELEILKLGQTITPGSDIHNLTYGKLKWNARTQVLSCGHYNETNTKYTTTLKKLSPEDARPSALWTFFKLFADEYKATQNSEIEKTINDIYISVFDENESDNGMQKVSVNTLLSNFRKKLGTLGKKINWAEKIYIFTRDGIDFVHFETIE